MSKKIAAGANKIVIDLTCGNGAFMKNRISAVNLAKEMVKIGESTKKEVRCVITDMSEPVGYAVGNSLEIIESVKALKGDMPKDVEEIVYALGSQMLVMAGKAKNEDEANGMSKVAIETGKAYEKFKELVQKQGGDISYIEDVSKFKVAEYIVEVPAKRSGNIVKINTEKIGRVSSMVGAGRISKDDKIDFTAGIIINKKINDRVKKGEPLAYIHRNKKAIIDEAVKEVQQAYSILNIYRIKNKTIIQTVK